MFALYTLLYAAMAADRPPPEPITVVDEYGKPLFTVGGSGAKKKKQAKRSPSEARAATTAPPRCPDDMVYVAGGKYWSRQIPAFCLDTHEVTVAEFVAHLERMDKGGEITKTRLSELKRHLKTVDWPGIALPAAGDRSAHCAWRQADNAPNLPINCVSYAEAEQYCVAHGRRLPSEREWRWAARGRTAKLSYPWGNVRPRREYVIMAHGEGQPRLSEVGTCKASRAGLHDMAGNVWEWVAADPAETEFTACGGSFRSRSATEVKVTAELKAGTRNARSDEVGFRCAGPARTAERSP